MLRCRKEKDKEFIFFQRKIRNDTIISQECFLREQVPVQKNPCNRIPRNTYRTVGFFWQTCIFKRLKFERERIRRCVYGEYKINCRPKLIRHLNRHGSSLHVSTSIALTSKHTHTDTVHIVARWDQMLIPLIPLGNKVRNQFTERGTGRKAVDSGGDISQRVRPVCHRWGIEIAGSRESLGRTRVAPEP